MNDDSMTVETLTALEIQKECDKRLKDYRLLIVVGITFCSLSLALASVLITVPPVVIVLLCLVAYKGLNIALDAWKLVRKYKQVLALVARSVKYQEDFDRRTVGVIFYEIGIKELANGN